MELIKDDFAKGNLTANVSWTGFESIIIVVLITGIVFFFIYSKKILTAIVSLFGSVLVFTYLFLLIFLPKIEMYSQHAAIEFYKSVKHENVYVSTIGYKSYAHLFYSEAPMHVNKNAFNRDWLLSGEIDKKAYFVSKVNRKYEIQLNHPSLILIYEKNGFVFWLRKPEYDKYKLEIPN